MSAWLDGPIAGPMVEGDLCEVESGGWAPGLPRVACGMPATVIARNLAGSELLLCEVHAERHGLVMAVHHDDHDDHDDFACDECWDAAAAS